MANTLLFIVNPRAGRGRSGAALFEAVTYFSEAGYLVSVRQTKGPFDATQIVLDTGPNFDRIVCFGGDGTLNEVTSGILQLDNPLPLGYIPGGSTNDFAASLGLPSSPPECAKRILESRGQMFDIGTFNGRPFVYVASFGLFTKASYSASQSIKNQLGHFAYILEGVKDLSNLRPYRATIVTDDEVFDGSFLLGAITNSTSVGGLMKLQEDYVVMDDGKFELMLIPTPKSPMELQVLIRSILMQNYSGGGIIFRHVSRVVVETSHPFPWTLDGEFGSGAERVEIINHRKELNLLV